MARAKAWFAAFETPGRTGQVAVQRAGATGCPCISIDPCPCGRSAITSWMEDERDCL